MELLSEALPEMIATLIGVVVGGVGALWINRVQLRAMRRTRAKIILYNILGELEDNFRALEDAQPAYQSTEYGKSFYISTIAWETATTGGDLPDIIGFELADVIENQYSILLSLRYYVDLMTQVWFASDSIEAKTEIRAGFRKHILEGLTKGIEYHPRVIQEIARTQAALDQ